MVKFVIIWVVTFLATVCVVTCSNTTGVNIDSCEMPNGYKKWDCGSGVNKQCCSLREKCINAKPKDADELFTCSPERMILGRKAVRMILLPLLGTSTVVGVVAYILKVNHRNKIRLLCVVQAVFSVPLFYSPLWEVGFYSTFLAAFVAYVVDWKGGVWWVYQIAWIIQLFHLVAIFGPIESFHVPFLDLSVPGTKSNLADTIQLPEKNVELACSEYYGRYFTVLPIEKQAEGANPDALVFGFCDLGWLATVQSFLVLEGMLIMATTVLSIPELMSARGKIEDSYREQGKVHGEVGILPGPGAVQVVSPPKDS